MERLNQSIDLWCDRSDFSHFLGWAAQSVYALQKGSDGIVPSTGNLVPNLYRDLYESVINNKYSESEKYQIITNRISEIYQKDKGLNQSIPALKYIMSLYDLCQPFVMPPFNELDDDEKNSIKEMITNELEKNILTLNE